LKGIDKIRLTEETISPVSFLINFLLKEGGIMPFFLRKAFKIGPFRINLSKSGIGVSGGVTGARIGIRPDGRTYSHAGRYGLYHRQELGRLGGPSKNPDISIKTKVEEIRANLCIKVDKTQAQIMLELAQTQGNTSKAKTDILESVSTSPKFWDAFHKKRSEDPKEWDETIDLIWGQIFNDLKQKNLI